MSSDDDPNIDDHEQLLRRVLDREDMVVHDDNLGRWTPLNSAIRFDPDGMSIYLNSILVGAGAGADVVASTRSGSVVFAVLAGEARSVGLGVLHTPTGPDAVGSAHGSIVGDQGWSDAELRSRRNSLRTKFVLFWGEITVNRTPD